MTTARADVSGGSTSRALSGSRLPRTSRQPPANLPLATSHGRSATSREKSEYLRVPRALCKGDGPEAPGRWAGGQ